MPGRFNSSILDMLRAGGRFHVDYGELWASSSTAAGDASRFGRAIEGEWSWLYEGSTALHNPGCRWGLNPPVSSRLRAM